MKVEDLTWNTGRTVIELDDGCRLSIISPERNEYIREAKRSSPSAILHGWAITDAQADNDTWEVAVLGQRGPDQYWEQGRIRIDEWADYERIEDGDILYAYVPRDVVIDYANAHGGKPVED